MLIKCIINDVTKLQRMLILVFSKPFFKIYADNAKIEQVFN